MRFATVRNILFQVHMWVGLVLGLLLVIIGLSGSLLVYDEDFQHWMQPVPHVSGTGMPASLDRLIAAARDASGRERGQVQVVMPETSGEAVTIRFGQFSRMQGGERRGPAPVDVFVDPVSATVISQRTPTPMPIFGIAHQLHGSLLMAREGRQAVGWLGVAMLALGVSGLVLWWPKRGQWKYAFIVRRSAKGLRFHRELHAMLGIWTFIVFMVVSFSGVAIVFPQSINAMTGGAPLPVRARGVPEVEPLRGAARIGADEAAKLALAAVPESELRSVTLPAKANQAVSVGLAKYGSMNAGAVIDPYRGTVIQVRDPSTTFMGWQRPLHDGTVGGIWRFLVFLSGLLPAVFVFTGVVMWAKKRKARLSMGAPLAEGATP